VLFFEVIVRDKIPFKLVAELDRAFTERDPENELPDFRPPLPKGIGGGGAAGAPGGGGGAGAPGGGGGAGAPGGGGGAGAPGGGGGAGAPGGGGGGGGGAGASGGEGGARDFCNDELV